MSLLSPLSATLAIRQSPALDVEAFSPVAAASVAELLVVDVEASSVLTTLVDSNSTATSTTTAEAVVVPGAAADLAGRTTTSRSATVMRPSTSSLIGACWRKLTSTVLPS
jgi:hypothetical protein